MGLRIATNIPSVKARNSLDGTSRSMEKAMAQISTGSRITKAADDAAGLSISEGIIAGVRSYRQALRNTNDGISMVQVAEGGLSEVSGMVTRLRELAIQSASDSIGDKERGHIQKEVSQLKNEINRVSLSTKFGDRVLLDGSGNTINFQVGIDGDSDINAISYESSSTNAQLSNLGLDGLDLSAKEQARSALDDLDTAQSQVNGFRAGLGALQNRLISTAENDHAAIENLSAAKSRMRDSDIAESSANMITGQILQQATSTILSQANSSPQNALKLIG